MSRDDLPLAGASPAISVNVAATATEGDNISLVPSTDLLSLSLVSSQRSEAVY